MIVIFVLAINFSDVNLPALAHSVLLASTQTRQTRWMVNASGQGVTLT
jgi:hypothetical protein